MMQKQKVIANHSFLQQGEFGGYVEDVLVLLVQIYLMQPVQNDDEIY